MQIKLYCLLIFIYFEIINPIQLVPENLNRVKVKRKVKHYKRLRTDPVVPSYPIVLVPGDGGSRLKANLTGKPSVVRYQCYKKTSDFFDLWLNFEELIPLSIECWADNMKLIFNNVTMMSENNLGVDIDVPGFGETDTVEWLDASKWSPSLYFAKIVDALVTWGYSREKNIAGSPFDWRKAPHELDSYFKQLKILIEAMYQNNGNKKVVIIGHSMGNPIMNYFYHKYVDQDWKTKFIQSHISLAGAWGGSMQIVKLFSSGYNMDYYRIILPPSYLRSMQRSFTSSAFLFPSRKLWSENEFYAFTPTKNYSNANINTFFNDINYSTGILQYNMTKDTLILDSPGVEVHCLYGAGIKTAGKFKWNKSSNFPDYQPDSTIYDNGDGTVNIRSLEVCKKWKTDNNNGKKVKTYKLLNADHMSILIDKRTIDAIRSILYNKYDY